MTYPQLGLMAALLVGVGLGGCYRVPPAVVVYAQNDLPGRNAGPYSVLIPELRRELVLNDAAMACSVDVAKGAEEKASAPCQCAHSSADNWEQNCQAWFSTARPSGLSTP